MPTQHACDEYMYLMYVANCKLPLEALGEPSASMDVAHAVVLSKQDSSTIQK